MTKENIYDRVAKSGSVLLSSMVDAAAMRVGNENRFGSQIEAGLAVAMVLVADVWHKEFEFIDKFNMKASELKKIDIPAKSMGAIVPQVLIGPYRVDFLIFCKDSIASGVVVECDGHEFHEKTKEQAARDKARDRFLTQLGYRVIRFTGSEIWNDPVACAIDALGLAQDVALERSLDAYKRGVSTNDGLKGDEAE